MAFDSVASKKLSRRTQNRLVVFVKIVVATYIHTCVHITDTLVAIYSVCTGAHVNTVPLACTVAAFSVALVVKLKLVGLAMHAYKVHVSAKM